MRGKLSRQAGLVDGVRRNKISQKSRATRFPLVTLMPMDEEYEANIMGAQDDIESQMERGI
jgi:hypothetical protein